MWGPGSTVLGNIGELSQSSTGRTFRWPGAAREMVRVYLEHRSVRIIGEGRVWCSNQSEGTDHKNRRSVGKSTWRLFGGNS
jgi:hypothetical protein